MTVKKNNSLLPHARKLRREMTSHERKLWYLFLRKYPIKIYKQRIIDSYIADFYCHSAKLVIELDGSQHYTVEAKEYDEERTRIINSYGIEVLRFTNPDIDKNFEAVCMMIDRKIREKIPSQNGGNING